MHIKQRPNGRWEAIVQHHGQRRKVVAPTKADAQIRAAQALIDMGGSPVMDPTVNEVGCEDHRSSARPISPAAATSPAGRA